MATPLRLLIADDSESDALLLIRELRAHGVEPAYERVDTAAAMQAALDRQTWDLVIGDYSMPQFRGTAALELLQSRGLDIPFIFVSGTISEDVAIEAMRAGARDYVMKGNLRRLLPAIDRELRAATQRRERRQLETTLRELVDRAPVGIYRSTLAGRILSANAALARMLGYAAPDELLSLDLARDVYADPAERQRLVERDTYTDREYDEVQATWRAKDGRRLNVQLSVRAARNAAGAIEFYETFVTDVTEQRRLEAQFLQSQKMEAVGRLAGGVAHDFNNLLTVILSYASLLLEDWPPDHPDREDVEQIRKAAEGAAGLTRQLLAFSRRQVLDPKITDVNAVVGNIEKMLARLLGEDIRVVVQPAADLGMVRVDPGQLEQVILNLAVNARDAMPKGGILTIETMNADMDEAYVQGHPIAAAGRYVMLAVSDTGTGMDEATQARIFEPFFTTKEAGKGTGLGLATVHGIVRQSGGFIWVYSEVGRGASFKIYLPRVDAMAAGAAPALAAVRGGTETILVVEDVDAVRRVTSRLLERLGYKVLQAADGAAALRLVSEHPAPIDLLLTDVVMPDLGGPELADKVRARRSEIKVLFMSGYTDGAIVHNGVLNAGIAYLQKPLTPATLATKVREVLGHSAGLDAGRRPSQS
jgi:PAS domain S-box-containing protein